MPCRFYGDFFDREVKNAQFRTEKRIKVKNYCRTHFDDIGTLLQMPRYFAPNKKQQQELRRNGNRPECAVLSRKHFSFSRERCENQGSPTNKEDRKL